MAPRGSQQNRRLLKSNYPYLDPWLHEGANRQKTGCIGSASNLDPWLHEGANKEAYEDARYVLPFRSMAPRGSQPYQERR